MKRVSAALSFVVLVMTGSLIVLSCGAYRNQTQLQSITMNPSSADAKDYQSGEVPFLATGNYANPAHSVTPLAANWVACQQNVATSDVSVTSSGIATCAHSASGTYSVIAWVFNTNPGVYNCPAVVTACGGGCTIVGTAQLTCP